MPPSPQQPQAAAGWYPVDGNTQRYWDGYEWTNHLAPLAPGGHMVNQITSNDRTYALIMHLGGLFVSFLVPLVMWLIKKDESPFVNFHGRQALNFHLSMLIYTVVSFLLIFVVIGFFLLPIVVLLYFIFGIIAAVKAQQGEYYRIPMAIQFLSS